MVIKYLECNYKCGNIACLKYHYESCHKDKIDKCICGNITISAICANDFSLWGCSLKNESSSSSGFGSGSGSNSSSSSNSSSDSVSISSSSSSSGSDSSYSTSSNSDPNPNSNSVPNPNYNSEVLISERGEVLGTPTAAQMHLRSCYGIRETATQIREVVTPIRNCNKCNYIKPLTDFDESKYTCRTCTSAKVNCPYCTSVMRYDGIRAHVKKQHPGVELTKGFSRNLGTDDVRGKPSSWGRASLVSPTKTEGPYTDLSQKTINPRVVSPLVISQTEEICSCKYYDFVSFLINNGINIEKIKENINLLKSIDNLK